MRKNFFINLIRDVRCKEFASTGTTTTPEWERESSEKEDSVFRNAPNTVVITKWRIQYWTTEMTMFRLNFRAITLMACALFPIREIQSFHTTAVRTIRRESANLPRFTQCAALLTAECITDEVIEEARNMMPEKRKAARINSEQSRSGKSRSYNIREE